jgi:hypothetical protein
MPHVPYRWLAAGILLGVIGTAAAVTPSDILKAYKKPSSSQAVGLPLAEHPLFAASPPRPAGCTTTSTCARAAPTLA